MLRPNSIHRSPADQRLDDACRRLLDCCNKIDRRLTTTEIIAVLVRTLAAEIAADVCRNNLDVSKIANDYGDLLQSSIASMEDDLRSRTRKWK